jgi:hypothetical protein
MPNMMPGMGTYMLFWLALATLVFLLLIGTCIWLVAGWLKKQRTSMMQDIPQPQDAYEGYEQGNQPLEQPPETYQEGGQRYYYPQNEQPQAQHQEP